MRLLVFFDLPVTTEEDRKNYRKFRRELIKLGFYMLQESVYCRMLINEASAKFTISLVERISPEKGLINVLTVTEKQFASMAFIIGENHTDVINSTEGTVFL